MENMKRLMLLILMLNSLCVFSQHLSVEKLHCEYLENPMGLDVPAPRLSWVLSADSTMRNVTQKAYWLQVVKDKPVFSNEAEIVWDTKKVESDQSVHIKYNGKQLSSGTRYYWRVNIWDSQGRESGWSTPSYWETGLMDSLLWLAQWITPDIAENESIDQPSPLLRKEFLLEGKIKKARLFITSRGLYSASINGNPVTDQLFTPGWTSYHKRLQYQVCDVTNLLQNGANVAGVMLADGWFRGPLGPRQKRNYYGNKRALLYQLEIENSEGEKKTITSDNSWKSILGPIRLSSIYDGEIYDANYELENWDTPAYEAKDWNNVKTMNYPKDKLISSVGVPVKRIEEVKPVQKIITPKNELVFDFGQNLVGRLKIRIKGNKNDTLTILHAEVLDPAGNFYTDNLRTAKQKIQYIFKDNNEINYEPVFTFQGFRYICIKNFKGTIDKENIAAVVIHSEMEQSGYFECSDSMINQLQSNIRWGQKGNFLDVPTDCPQRDERLGWTADVQVFASTAMFNYNTVAFFSKWLKDLKADQSKNGSIPDVIPDIRNERGGSTGWGDASTIVPYTMYLKYNDKRILEEQYESMKRWVEYLHNLAGKDLILDSGRHLGDWLFFIHPTDWNTKPGYTDVNLIATAFFAHSSKLLAKTAEILDNKTDMVFYNQLFDSIKVSFNNEFMTKTGRLSSNSQTAYVLALYFELVPEELKTNVVEYLVKDIVQRNYHLSTGFLGTPYLCHVLSENGKTDVAYKLLMQKTYPSWLYPINKGATTIWERWDGIKPDGSYQTIVMNSFNHYAYGAIGDWMYSVVAGIRADETKPGYKHFIVKPEPDPTLNYAKAGYESLYGKIETYWKTGNEQLYLSVTVPSNTTATIYLPYTDRVENVGSGKYTYSYKVEK